MKRLSGAIGSHGTTRRRFLKQAAAGAGVAALGASVPAVRRARAQSYEGVELNILSWPGWGDPHITTNFEEQTGAKVIVKEYIGGEAMMAVLSQTPPGSFDLVLSDHEYLTQLRAADQIVALDPDDYHFDQYWPEFQRFEPHWSDGEMYAVLTSFGYIGIAYNSTKLSAADVASYDILWDAKVKGKLGWFDWYLPNMGCLSLYDGNRPPYDIDDAAFAKLKDTLFSLRAQEGAFLSMADVFSSLSNEQMWISPGIGDWVAQILQDGGLPIAATVPKEGGVMWSDSWAVAKTAKTPELAKDWIQFVASPEGQIRAATLPAFARNIPNIEGWKLLNAEKPEWATRLRHHFDERNVVDEYREGNIFARGLPIQQSSEEWGEVWTEFKSS
jgi:spermidine/putrescine transport system substrate-binding protein